MKNHEEYEEVEDKIEVENGDVHQNQEKVVS